MSNYIAQMHFIDDFDNTLLDDVPEPESQADTIIETGITLYSSNGEISIDEEDTHSDNELLQNEELDHEETFFKGEKDEEEENKLRMSRGKKEIRIK